MEAENKDMSYIEEKVKELNSQTVVCASCLNRLNSQEEVIETLNQKWHVDCFRCSVCDAVLSDWYFEKDSLLFCREDYWIKYGDACQDCSQIITGPIMVAGNHKFHPECFRCISCSCFIEVGETYALVERSKLYCGQCYIVQIEEPVMNQATSTARLPHSIRVIEIPPCQITNEREIKLMVHHNPDHHATTSPGIRISQLDNCSDLRTLQVGDRILEVNGLPVTDKSLNEIEKLIRCSDKMLQLTVEHGPETRVYKGTLTQNDSPRIGSTSGLKQNDLERIYKKRDEGYLSGSRSSRQLRRGRNSSGKGRSSSLSRLLEGCSSNAEECDLSRTKSFREEQKYQRIFRASDLVKGDLIGRGFFGQVYRVTHRESGEIMVLKEIYRVDDKNFLNEITVLRSLHHQNLLSFIGVVYKEKKFHLVTEYIAGGTLRRLLRDMTRVLTWSDRAKLARDISSGMAYLHSMNIIHRDLNSHNCLVREDNTVVVADFGLARVMPQNGNANESFNLPVPGTTDESTRHYTKAKVTRRYHRKKRYTVVGNPYWMAPEMMKGNKYDEKVDVFSFGIILCEIIGRVNADPDYLPRTPDFGLNQSSFIEKFCLTCPECLYKIAFLSCELNPDKRPAFDVMEGWLSKLAAHLSETENLPQDLEIEIFNFSGKSNSSSESTTPEVITPEECRHSSSTTHNLPPHDKSPPANDESVTIERTSL